jgi:ABC-type transport system involved in multi-copper enzyme maturation permease subunit
LLKLRRQRPTLVMTTLGVLFLAVVMLVYATNPTLQAQLVHHPLSGFYGILSPLQLFFTMGAGIAILLTASRLLGMEYDLGTIRVLLGRGTGRWQMLFAKLVAVAIYAAGGRWDSGRGAASDRIGGVAGAASRGGLGQLGTGAARLRDQ